MAAAATVAGSLLLTVGCSSSSSGSGSTSGNPGSGTNWATASSAAAGGGMNALVAAAKKEGTLNVITLPSNWANYGTIMKDFTAKYGIKINDANPDGSSQDRDPVGRLLRGLLRPGHQQVRPAPGRGPAVGGIPVLGHRPEPVAAGPGPADRAVHAGEGRRRRPGGLQGAAARSGRERHLPDAGTAGRGGEHRRAAVV